VFKRVCQLNIFDSNVVQPCYGPEEDERVPSPLVRLISVRIAYPGQSDRPMAKVVVPTDMTVAQFVGRVQALLQEYAGELPASPAVTPHWRMRLASDTATPLLYPPTPAGTPAHLSSWEQHLPISATGIGHHSVVAVAPDLSALITVFVSCPGQVRTNTPIYVPDRCTSVSDGRTIR
jgi:hypothetical protein